MSTVEERIKEIIYSGDLISSAKVKLIMAEIANYEKCTCQHFHEGNCKKSNFYEYEVIDMRLKKAMIALQYVLRRCKESVYFKDPDIQTVVQTALDEIERIK